MASREKFARTLGSNTGMAAIIGPAQHVDTVGGFVAWRVFGLLIIVGAVWGLLTATRLLRREEDAGRWELFLAGRTTRRHAAAQALVGMAAGWLVLWTLTAALTVIAGSRPNVGFSVSSSLFYATATTASAAMFLALGALASQLAQTRRQANGLAAAAFALFYLIRMVADSGTGLECLRWVSPLGWVENIRPLTGSQPLALVPIAMLTAAAAGAAISLAGRRDLGAGVLARSQRLKPSTRLLGGPALLVIWLERWVALAWIGGLASLALIFGVVARSAAAGNVAVRRSSSSWVASAHIQVAPSKPGSDTNSSTLPRSSHSPRPARYPPRGAKKPMATWTTCSPATSAKQPGSPGAWASPQPSPSPPVSPPVLAAGSAWPPGIAMSARPRCSKPA